MAAKIITEAIVSRFITKSVRDASSGCLVWAGARLRGGYGGFKLWGKEQRAHRIAWLVAHGEIPLGTFVLHRCDNPPCVEITHLFLGDNVSNMADMKAKGRAANGDRNGARLHPERWGRGERHYRAKLTVPDVVAIRSLYAEGCPVLRLAVRFGVSRRNVKAIVSRKTWAHIG